MLILERLALPSFNFVIRSSKVAPRQLESTLGRNSYKETWKNQASWKTAAMMPGT